MPVWEVLHLEVRCGPALALACLAWPRSVCRMRGGPRRSASPTPAYSCARPQVPFGGANGMEVLLHIHHEQRPPIKLPPALARYEGLIARCWHQQPEQRPSMEEVMQVLQAMRSVELHAGAARELTTTRGEHSA